MNGSKSTIPLTYPQVVHIADHFLAAKDYRMECVVLLLARCLRIGDVVRTLKMGDVYSFAPGISELNLVGVLNKEIAFREEKTNKKRMLEVGESSRLYHALVRYWVHEANYLPSTAQLFYGKREKMPLLDGGVKKLLAQFVGQAQIRQCSPHSFRKFGARYIWEVHKVPLEVVSDILNHSNPKTTRVYLGINSDDVTNANRKLQI